MKLFVFVSSRKIRAYYENLSAQNALLDEAISMQDFLDKILLSPYRKASDYERLLLMQKACLQTKNSQKLHINENFFAFLRNHEYLFSFFKELSLEKKSILHLQNNDYYAQYNEHLEILDELFKNYLLNLKQNELSDEISLSFDYTLNTHFLNSFDEIIFDLQGFLSAFEREILKQSLSYTRIILKFRVSVFNEAFLKKTLVDFDINNIELKHGYEYELILNTKEIQSEKKIVKELPQIIIKDFEQRSLQCAFVYEQISEFVRAGLNPKKIVVITPDEEFCILLRLFDQKNMLNYASGISIKEQSFYQRLRSLYEVGTSDDFKSFKPKESAQDKQTYLAHSQNLDLYNTLLAVFELDTFDSFKELLEKKISFEIFKSLIDEMINQDDELIQWHMKQAITQELLFIKNLLKEHEFSLKELLELFFLQIQGLKSDFIAGGQVTVMGLLETRGLEFDGVIIVDFNDDFIPKRSVNELFLNNEVRAKAGLISYEQRENLQRFYYENLIKGAKKVAISYIKNEERDKARFLDDLNLSYQKYESYSQEAYLKALRFSYMPNTINIEPLPAQTLLDYDLFAKPLSFSRFDCFLNYKRTYFYKYILKIPEPRILSQDKTSKDFGILLHDYLQRYFKQVKNHFSCEHFFELFAKELDLYLSGFEKELLRLRLQLFEKSQNEHFQQGFKVLDLEYLIPSKELTLKLERKSDQSIIDKNIILEGRVDRIDQKDEELLVIDYKYVQNLEKNQKPFQLAFYQLLTNASKAGFYDLRNLKFVSMIEDTSLKNKLIDKLTEIANEHLNDEDKKGILFDNDKENMYCPYRLIYAKDEELKQ